MAARGSGLFDIDTQLCGEAAGCQAGLMIRSTHGSIPAAASAHPRSATPLTQISRWTPGEHLLCHRSKRTPSWLGTRLTRLRARFDGSAARRGGSERRAFGPNRLRRGERNAFGSCNRCSNRFDQIEQPQSRTTTRSSTTASRRSPETVSSEGARVPRLASTQTG